MVLKWGGRNIGHVLRAFGSGDCNVSGIGCCLNQSCLK